MQLNADPTSNITSPNGGSPSTTGSQTPVNVSPPGDLNHHVVVPSTMQPQPDLQQLQQAQLAAPGYTPYNPTGTLPQYPPSQMYSHHYQQPPLATNMTSAPPGYQHSQQGGNLDPAGQEQDTSGKLFVGQVPYITNEEQLTPLFSPYGTIVEIKIMRDHDQRSRGCAWVRYATKEEAQAAIDALHNKHTIPPQTNLLQVRFAQQGGAGGGGGARGGRGGASRGASRGGAYPNNRGGGGGYRGGYQQGGRGGGGGYNPNYNPMMAGMMGGGAYGGYGMGAPMTMPQQPHAPNFRGNNNPYASGNSWDAAALATPNYYASQALMNTFVSAAGAGAMPSPQAMPYYSNAAPDTGAGGAGVDQQRMYGGGGWQQ